MGPFTAPVSKRDIRGVGSDFEWCSPENFDMLRRLLDLRMQKGEENGWRVVKESNAAGVNAGWFERGH